MPYDLFLIKKLLKSRICEIHKTVHEWLGQIIWLKEKKKKKKEHDFQNVDAQTQNSNEHPIFFLNKNEY